MAEIAILAAIEVGLAVAQFFLTPRPKQQPVDRGKQGDLRFTLAAEGEPYPYVFGERVRVAGVMIDCGRTKEIKSSSPGSQGGKKGQGGTPPTTNYSYTKTFAIAFAANEIKSFRQIKEDDTILLDFVPENASSNFYEGEDASNTFTAPTAVSAFANASNGFEITLQSPGNGAVQFNSVLSNVAGTRKLVIYYRNDIDTDIELTVNGGAPATYTLNNSGNTTYATRTIDITCINGANTIKIKNLHATHNLGIDRIYVFAGHQTTSDPFTPRKAGAIASISYPANQNDPSAFYDAAPAPSVDGVITGQLSTNGQAPFELFLGKSDQPQSSILMSLPGRDSTNTPAYEELVTANFQDYHLTEGRQTLGNITAELEPKLQYLDEILEFLYLLDGYTAAEIDFSAGANILVKGFVVDRREALAPFAASLGEAYGFDIVPIDGKCVLVMRNGASVFSIPEEECFGREEGQEMPKGPISTQHNPMADVPGSVDVQYLDPSSTKEFHTADARYTRQLGGSSDPDTLVLPLVMERDDALAIGKRYLWEKKQRNKPKAFATGPRYRHLTPGDVGTVVTETATHRLVLTSTQAAFTGLVKFQAVPQRGALYTQLGPANPAGTEVAPVPHPANTFMILADVPALRDADENQLLTYVAACGRGAGKWRGARVFRERVAGSDEWDILAALPHPATAGVLVSSVPGVSDPTSTDVVNSIVIDLFFDEDLFESRSLADIQSRFINAVVIGSGQTAEIIQFANVTYSSGSFPYVRRVTLSQLLRGRRGTVEGALAGAAAGASVFLLTDAIASFVVSPDDLSVSHNFKGVTAGQAVDNASTTVFACSGYSARGPQPDPSKFIAHFDTVTGDILFECGRNEARLQSQQEKYEFQASIPAADDTFTNHRGGVVSPGDWNQPIIWDIANPSPPSTNVTIEGVDPGGLNFSPPTGPVTTTTVKSKQSFLIGEGIIFECTIPNDRPLPSEFGIANSDASKFIYFSSGAQFPGTQTAGYSCFASDNSGTAFAQYTAVPGDRLTVIIRPDAQAQLFINYLGPSSVPFFTSRVTFLQSDLMHAFADYFADVNLGFKTGLRKALISRTVPQWRYIATAQKVDNSGLLPLVIKARVRQYSFVAGGQASAWTTKTFFSL